ncbi:MAG: hypothetical protein OXQ32_06660 [bacterium]|nr:hypothetical protein [bacterium]
MNQTEPLPNQAPHQDIATLFYTRCAELYANPPALIGMVMPYSVLRSGHHLKWRRGEYSGTGKDHGPVFGLDLRVYEPWDLDNVVPDFFRMPASVVFAQKVATGEGTALAPATVQVWRGDWEKDFAGISRSGEILYHDDGTFRSPYGELSTQGPTMFDRRLFFVETIESTAKIQTALATKVSPRLGSQDHYKYENQLHKLEGVVSNDHLFDVYVGACLAPYVALNPLKAVLPVCRSTMTMPLEHDENCDGSTHKQCHLDMAALHPNMQIRWQHISDMYYNANKKRTIRDLYRNLNHNGKLTSQLEYLQRLIAGNSGVRVAYTAQGEPTAAIIEDNHAVIESKAYQVKCWNRAEAYYVLAIINSNHLASQAKPFCTTNWAKKIRDFHLHAWKLPIPRYDSTNPLHGRLSELGNAAEQECTAMIVASDILTKPPGGSQSDTARQLIRREWQPNSPTAHNIETAVGELLPRTD